jgi:glycosyltransferase involved in cell wall biosynthesis/peptidoglycan/xylan/chitin deacetylase (PgdA/CDA1 family)
MVEDSRARNATQLAHVRLGLFLNLPLHQVGAEYTARYPHLFDFFLALGSRTAQTTIVVPLKREGLRNPEYGKVTVPPRVRIVGLPYWSSARMMVRRIHRVAPATLGFALTRMGRLDLVGAVAPSVVGTILIAVARLRGRPVFLLVRGEKQRTVRWIMGERRARPYVAALRAMEAPVRHWIRAGVPTFVAGHELVERYLAPNARLHNLYPGLSRDFPLASAARTTPGDPMVPRLLTVARLSPEKGIDDVLRSVAILRDAGVDVTLEVAGEGPQRAELEALARDLEVTDRVRLAGFVPHGAELISMLDSADVFVLASRSEGLPHSMLEAMARALPVVATDVGGMPALLGDGAGVVVPVGDPAALAAVLIELRDDPARWAELSAESLATAYRMHPDAQLTEFCAHIADAYPGLVAGQASSGENSGRVTAHDRFARGGRPHRHAMTDILVLSYHAVSRDWPAAMAVVPERLEAQMRLLVSRGYRGATLHDAVHDPPGPRTVAVTFDDAYRSVLEEAFPILERAGFPATVFVPTDFPDAEAPMSWPGIQHWHDSPHVDELRCLSWPQLRSLADAGWEIGSHARSHPYLTKLADDELAHELRESRERCERALERPCRSLAYPYGDHNERVVAAARQAGFTTACTVPDALTAIDPLTWPRVGIYRTDGMVSFRVKVSRPVRRARTTRAADFLLPVVRRVLSATHGLSERTRRDLRPGRRPDS